MNETSLGPRFRKEQVGRWTPHQHTLYEHAVEPKKQRHLETQTCKPTKRQLQHNLFYPFLLPLSSSHSTLGYLQQTTKPSSKEKGLVFPFWEVGLSGRQGRGLRFVGWRLDREFGKMGLWSAQEQQICLFSSKYYRVNSMRLIVSRCYVR